MLLVLFVWDHCTGSQRKSRGKWIKGWMDFNKGLLSLFGCVIGIFFLYFSFFVVVSKNNIIELSNSTFVSVVILAERKILTTFYWRTGTFFLFQIWVGVTSFISLISKYIKCFWCQVSVDGSRIFILVPIILTIPVPVLFLLEQKSRNNSNAFKIKKISKPK